MKFNKLLSALAIGTAMFTAAPTFAAQVVGLPELTNTGNCYPFGCSYSGEYQQVYDAAAFSAPITIYGLEFYNTSYSAGATSLNSGNWSIALSTTAASPSTLDATFANNIGGDNTAVFNGNLAQSWAFGNTLVINFQTPFAYNPNSGNLLMDVNVNGASQTGAGVYFNASNSQLLGRNYGSTEYSYGLVTGFITTPVPEPETYALLLAGLGVMGAFARRRKEKQA